MDNSLTLELDEASLDNKANSGFFHSIWKKILQKKHLILSFFAPFFILSITFLIVGMAPRGGTSILVLDANAQYVRFHEQLWDILHGNESLFYTFQRALGGEFLGYYTYYLSSPLTLIIALFPKRMIIEAMTLITLLKAGLSGLTFCIYLSKTRRKNTLGFTMFSVMYALCAYAVAYQSNYMWMDALIWLPLITLGIESVIKENKFKLFIIALAVAIWSNYYIGYMLCIFTLVYFIFFLCTHSKEITNPNGENLHILKSILRFVLYVGIALLICATVLFSAVYALGFGKAGSMDSDLLIPATRASFFEILTKMFIGTFGTFRPISDGGMPHLYAGTLLVILLPVFFISKSIKLREKIGYGILCTFFLASLTISTIDIAWHGFSEPVWLSYRYSFIFTFIMLIIGYRAFEKIDEFKIKYFAIASGSIVGLLFILQATIHPIQFISGNKTETNLGIQTVWPTLILLVGYFFLFFLLKKKPSKRKLFSILLAVLVSLEALTATAICYEDQFTDAGWTSRSTYYAIQNNANIVSDYFKETDDGFYRAESFSHKETNDPIIFNTNGVSEFVSTFNISTKDFLYALGFNAGNQSSFYKYNDNSSLPQKDGNIKIFNRILNDSLLGIKYVYAKSDEDLPDNLSKYYQKLDELENGYVVYKNPYALSVAYTVDKSFKNVTIDSAKEFLDKDSLGAIHSMTGKQFGAYLANQMLNKGYPLDMTKENLIAITNELSKGELKITDHSSTNIKGTINADNDKFVFTTIPYDEFWHVYVDGERVETFKCVDSMLAFDIDEGEHTIEIKYVPIQFYAGLGITLVGILSLLSLCLADILIKHKNKEKITEAEKDFV